MRPFWVIPPAMALAFAVPSELAAITNVALSTPAAPKTPKLPSFAPSLAAQTTIGGPEGWKAGTYSEALARLASASTDQRQEARWAFALSLQGMGRNADVLGVLDVMLQDDPDLSLIPNFQLFRGATLVSLGRHAEAAVALNHAQLESNPEACAWRMRAFTGAKAYLLAIRQVSCAASAVNLRAPGLRISFVQAAAESALQLGQGELALKFLRSAPSRSPAANLQRSRAYLALGRLSEARLANGQAEQLGGQEQIVTARINSIEAAMLGGSVAPKQAIKDLEQVRYAWRGDENEKRALRLIYSLARKVGDQPKALEAGATLIRYHRLGADLPPLVRDVQSIFKALLETGSEVPVAQAAGLYWNYRDLAPVGSEGSLLATMLADRLVGLGLYARAAELLAYQLQEQVKDVAQGPLSVRVAKLHILSGRPERAIATLNGTSSTILPQDMIWDRQRVEAVALFHLGRSQEALAVLQDVPGSSGLRSELLWKQRDWQTFVATNVQHLPSSSELNDVSQASILKQAIALGMLSREADLAALRARYLVAFKQLPTAEAFDLLTSASGLVDAEALSRAMAAIPVASPAGDLANLLEMIPSTPKRSGN